MSLMHTCRNNTHVFGTDEMELVHTYYNTSQQFVGIFVCFTCGNRVSQELNI